MTHADLAAKELNQMYHIRCVDSVRSVPVDSKDISAIIQKHCPEPQWVEGAPKEDGVFCIETSQRSFATVEDGTIYTHDRRILISPVKRHCKIHLPN